MKLLTFDIGGTAVKYGVVENGVVIEKIQMPTNTQNGQAELSYRLISAGKDLLKKYPDIVGVGVSTTGNVNFETGNIDVAPDNIPEFLNFNFKNLFKAGLGLKCVADNDVNSFAAGEMMYGSGRKYSTYLVMTLGTGIGGAIIVDSKMWRGKIFGAGEIGRIRMYDTSYENMASVTALVNIAKKAGLNISNGKDVFDLYDQGNSTAIKVINEYYDNVSYGLLSLIYTFNPEAIIIGGGVSGRPTLCQEITRNLNTKLNKGYINSCDIVPATFKNDGGMIGAYANYVSVYGEE